MNLRKWTLLILGILAAISLISGCGGDKKADKKPEYLRYVIGEDPQSLDPRKALGVPEGTVLYQIYEGLLTYDKKGNLVPGVAESWEVSADGLTYTFKLRDNARWSNGEPVTAKDFVYSWKSTLSPELASKYAEQLYIIKGGKAYNHGQSNADAVAVMAKDDHTLTVTLERPAPYFLSMMAFYTYFPVNAKMVESNSKWAAEPSTMITNGPFKVKSWNHGAKIELEKNDKYWDSQKVKMAKADILIANQQATRASLLENGQADYVDGPQSTDVERLKAKGNVTFNPQLSTYYYQFNFDKEALKNPKVREALFLALDREAIVQTVKKGNDKVAYAITPPGFPDAEPNSDFRKIGGDLYPKMNVERAKQLLAEAGYPDGKGFPTLSFVTNQNEEHKAIAEAVQEMWKKNLGVNMNIDFKEWKVFLEDRKSGQFDVARRSWVADYMDPWNYAEIFIGGHMQNEGRYKNADYDAQLRIVQESQDPKVRMAALHQAEKIATGDFVVIPFYHYNQAYLSQPYVKDLYLGPLGAPYFKEAYIE